MGNCVPLQFIRVIPHWIFQCCVGIWRRESVLMMLRCCKTCMGCHEAGTGGCHASWWCDIVTWHRMLARTPWWGHGHCEMRGDDPHSSVIIQHIEHSSEDPVCHQSSWVRVLQTSSPPWHPTQCSLLRSRPRFSESLRFMMGVPSVSDVILHSPHQSLVCRRQCPMSLCLPRFAQSVIQWDDQLMAMAILQECLKGYKILQYSNTVCFVDVRPILNEQERCLELLVWVCK